ncbi:MAG: gamma-glutamyl-gamma-aminobutyrate hydrolase family protein [Actinomycetota bacterium]|nr:gamma-glutamyl-gamma-aminobutyrate hydrolase family protein [Actinomycetota bacterium]MDI6822146.1 gamma-glutamyl-gamma-aminobutyrate hydrolase family protein [Actinomycetota bacterium]
MSKALIINNYLNSREVRELAQVVGIFCDYEIWSYGEIDVEYKLKGNIGAVILSGSEARIVETQHVAKFNHVANLIRRIEIPLLGICFGHQLMCLALGAEVGALERVVDKFEFVRIIGRNDLFKGFKAGQSIPLAEWHHDYVKKDSLPKANLRLLADSPSCEVEAVKHDTRPLYGIQFHAERFHIRGEEHREGIQVIENFCSMIRN